jgi:2-keto-3-deoxy-L-rhamnonate aldolase RhmA
MFEYSRRANDEVRVRVLIEHPRAIENLDAILRPTMRHGAPTLMKKGR